MLEKPTYAPTSFALYANRIIFNSGDYFLALKNRQAVKEFAEQFNKLWSKCKHGEAVLGFLNDRIKDLLNFA